jgi:hypothetical protein
MEFVMTGLTKKIKKQKKIKVQSFDQDQTLEMFGVGSPEEKINQDLKNYKDFFQYLYDEEENVSCELVDEI